ncbi:MAG: MATE family efflux transporter [Muribaculum sp.]|nr:MATE family efflux transporter [Muribaculum sp.]
MSAKRLNITFSTTNREILHLAVPSIVTNITTPLLGLMDVAITGHMGSAAYIGAIAVGGSMFNMLYWLFGFLRMGSSGMTAQAYGSGDILRQSVILKQALTVGFLVSLAMILLRHPICAVFLKFMDVDSVTTPLVSTYFLILVWGAPATLCLYSLTGWYLGMQNTKIPMWVSILINLSNIAISLTLVYGFHLDIEGVAIGTLSAQWIGFLTALLICLRKYRIKRTGWRDILQPEALKRFFSVNTDIFLRTVCLVAVTIWFTRMGAIQGEVMLAVNALLMQFFTLFSYFMDGFAFAGEAMTGKYVGRRDSGMLRSTIRHLISWGIGIAALFTTIYAFGGDLILSMLSSQPEVISRAHDFLPWVVTVPAAGFMAFTWDGIFIGATATRRMLVSMGLATAIFFLSLALLKPIMGNHGLWASFLLYLLTRGIVLSIAARRSGLSAR